MINPNEYALIVLWTTNIISIAVGASISHLVRKKYIYVENKYWLGIYYCITIPLLSYVSWFIVAIIVNIVMAS